MATSPRNRAEVVARVAERDIVALYRRSLAQLDRALATILRAFAAAGGEGYADLPGWQAGQEMLRALANVTDRITAMRATILENNLPRVAAARYRDILYQSQRIVRAAGNPVQVEGRLNRTPMPSQYAERVAVLNARPVGVYDRIQRAIVSGASPASLRQTILNAIAREGNQYVRAVHHMASEVVNGATVAAFETAQEAIMDQLGTAAAEAGLVMVWIHDEPDSPRDGHILMHGSLAEGGVWTNPLTGAQADGPGGFGDPAEDYNCLCTLTVMRLDEWREMDWAGQISSKGMSFADSVVSEQLDRWEDFVQQD